LKPLLKPLFGRLKTAFLVGATIIGLQGCGTQTLNIKDNNAPSVSLRGVVRIGEDKRNGIEAEWSRVSAKGSSVSGTGFPINLGDGTSLTTPSTFDNRVSADRVHIAFNQLLFADRPVEMEWFAGIAYDRLAWTVQPRNPSSTSGLPPASSINLANFAPTGGVTGRFKFADSWAFEGRIRGSLAKIGGVRSELAFVYRPQTSPVRLKLGFTQNNLEGSIRNAGTQLSLESRGPFVSLQFEY
jgi:hypothetical protein